MRGAWGWGLEDGQFVEPTRNWLVWSGVGSEQWWSAGMERRARSVAYFGSRTHRAGCTGAGGEVGAGGVPHLLGVRGTVYSETSREEQISPAPRSGRRGRRAHLSLARRRRRSPRFGPRRPPGLRFRFRFALAPAARASGHGVLHGAEGGPGLGGRPGRVAAAAQGLPVPRKARGAGAGARR